MKKKSTYSLIRRIVMVLSLAMVSIIVWIGILEYSLVSSTLREEQLNRLENIAYSFEADLSRVMSTVSKIEEDETLTRERRILAINEILQPIADFHGSDLPHIGIGYYSKNLEGVVCVVPWAEMGYSLGHRLTPDHPANNLYMGSPVQRHIESVLRGHVARYGRLVHLEGDIKGHIWVNIPFAIYKEKLIHSMLWPLFFILLILLSFILLVRFVASEIIKSSGRLIHEIENLFSTNTSSEELGSYLLPIEFQPLYDQFNDMTKRLNTTKEELARATRLATFGELATTIVHDIKNPLSTIRASAQLGTISLGSLEKNQDRFDRIISTVDELDDYLVKMLNKAKVDSVHDHQLISIDELLKNSLLLWEPIFENNHVKLDLNIDEKIKSFMIPSLMEQVLLNIVKNAIESMPNGGKIKLMAEKCLNDFVLSISDTGEGIPHEIQSLIFTRFFSTKVQGTGIGLASVQGTINDLGGKIWFESYEGIGTTFYIRLPIKENTLQDETA